MSADWLTEGLLAQTMAIVSSRLSAARSLLQRHNLYGSPPRHSFYSCASSRALLHVGSLSLWDRQPSNAPPLLLSPAGLASRRGPHTKTRLGLCPKSLLNWGPRKVVRPCGERRAHRSGEGCPNQGVGSARLKRRLRPTRRSKSATPAVAVQIMPLQKPTPTILNHKNPARSFLAPGGKLDACFIVLGCSLSSTASRCPTPAHKYPPCAGCSERFPGRSHRTDPHPLPPRRR